MGPCSVVPEMLLRPACSHSSILPLHSYITFFCIPRFMLPYLKFCFASSKEEYFVLLNHKHIPKPGTLFCCPSPPPLTPIKLSSRLVQPSICHEQIPTYLLADGQTSECMGGWKGGVEVNLGIMPSPPRILGLLRPLGPYEKAYEKGTT